jgi:hypothetical protein
MGHLPRNNHRADGSDPASTSIGEDTTDDGGRLRIGAALPSDPVSRRMASQVASGPGTWSRMRGANDVDRPTEFSIDTALGAAGESGGEAVTIEPAELP